MTEREISILILTARRPAKLLACLKSLERQTRMDFEVVVVDNAPTAKTEEIVRQSSLDVRIIKNPHSVSYAEARNLGVDAARGKFVAFIDDDCVADAGWLENLTKVVENADAAGGLVVPLHPLPFPRWWDERLNWLIGLSVPGLLGPKGGSIHYPQTANLIVRRDVLLKERFQEIGGRFGQKNTSRYAGREDVELWRRLRLRGWRCVIAPKAIVYHDIPPKRLRLFYLVRRAFNDGLAYFRREQKFGYLRWVIRDILSFLPTIIAERTRGEKISRTIATTTLTRIRQCGFIYGYITGGFPPMRIISAMVWFFVEAVRYAFALIKRLIREAIVAFYRRRRPRRVIPRNPQSLLVAGCGFLGDMVLLAPMLGQLRCSLPESKITLLCYMNGYTLFRDSGLVDEILVCPSAKDYALRLQRWFLKTRFDGKHYDAIVVPYYHDAPPQPVFVGLGATVATFDRDVGLPRRFWYEIADRCIKKDFNQHEILNLAKLAAVVGASIPPQKHKFEIPPKATANLKRTLKELQINDGSIILLHPGAGYPEKAWTLEHWAELALALQREYEAHLIFIGECELRKQIEKLCAVWHLQTANLCGKTDLWELAALIKRAALLITTDSGPKHLAIALGMPTLTLYGPSDERRWGALWDTEIHKCVRACPADLTAEELLGLPPDYAMRRITPDSVLSAIRKYAENLKRDKR